MNKEHYYKATIKWTGNTGSGTSSYQKYERSHEISFDNKPMLLGSSDPAFRGDSSMYNPEELLLASISACHMLWYLHLCAEAGIVVVDYIDTAKGTMVETADGGGKFTEVVLYPQVTITNNSKITEARELHHHANKLCFIANSLNFPVQHTVAISVVTK